MVLDSRIRSRCWMEIASRCFLQDGVQVGAVTSIQAKGRRSGLVGVRSGISLMAAVSAGESFGCSAFGGVSGIVMILKMGCGFPKIGNHFTIREAQLHSWTPAKWIRELRFAGWMTAELRGSSPRRRRANQGRPHLVRHDKRLAWINPKRICTERGAPPVLIESVTLMT